MTLCAPPALAPYAWTPVTAAESRSKQASLAVRASCACSLRLDSSHGRGVEEQANKQGVPCLCVVIISRFTTAQAVSSGAVCSNITNSRPRRPNGTFLGVHRTKKPLKIFESRVWIESSWKRIVTLPLCQLPVILSPLACPPRAPGSVPPPRAAPEPTSPPLARRAPPQRHARMARLGAPGSRAACSGPGQSCGRRVPAGIS